MTRPTDRYCARRVPPARPPEYARVLVVGPDRALGEAFTAEGYPTAQAESALTAPVTACDFKPDVCVVDPAGADVPIGDLARWLRAQAAGRAMVLVLVSDRPGAAAGGFDLSVPGPTTPGEVLAAVLASGRRLVVKEPPRPGN